MVIEGAPPDGCSLDEIGYNVFKTSSARCKDTKIYNPTSLLLLPAPQYAIASTRAGFIKAEFRKRLSSIWA